MSGSIHELMELFDTNFIDSCYEMLLGRRPNSTEAEGYLSILRLGQDKENILYLIATSEEARRFGANLDGLSQFLKLQRRLRTPPLGIVLRIIYHFRRQRLQGNRIEARLARLEQGVVSLSEAFRQFEGAFQASLPRPYDMGDAIKAPRAKLLYRLLANKDRN